MIVKKPSRLSYEIGEIENKEIVNNEDPIIEEIASNEKINLKVIKLEDIENNETIRAGIYVGYPKKSPPVVGIEINPIVLESSSNQTVSKSARYPYKPAATGSSVVNTNGNYDVFDTDDILGVGQLKEDLLNSGQAIKDNFNNLKDELTSGWDYDSLTSGSYSDAHALAASINNFVKNPKIIGKYLLTLQANINNDGKTISQMGQINMGLKKGVPFSPFLMSYKYSSSKTEISKLIPIQENFLNKESESYYDIDGLIVVADSVFSPEFVYNKNIGDSIISGWQVNSDDEKVTLYLDPKDEKHSKRYFVSQISGIESLETPGDKIPYKSYFVNYALGSTDMGLEPALLSVKKFAYDKINGTIAKLTEENKKQIDNQKSYLEFDVVSASGTTNIVYAPKTPNDYKGRDLIPALKDEGDLNPGDAHSTLANQITNLRSRSIEYLLQSGPDFMQHMYDIMLICSSTESDVSAFKNFFSKVSEESSIIDTNMNEILDSGCFMVRAGAIDIPQIENDSYDVKFLFNTIKKTRSKIKYEKRAELKILLDEPLIFLTFFNLLTNNNMTIFNGLHADNRYPMRFAPYSTNRLIKENIISKQLRVDLIVKHQKLLRYPEFEPLRTIWNKDSTNADVANFGGLASDELPIWWFEDVNFLGQGEDLTFDRDASETVEMSYPFLFKRCVKINRIHKGGMDADGLRIANADGDETNNTTEYHAFSESKLTKDETNGGNDFFYDQSDQEWYVKYINTRNMGRTES
jgi:hypothetical protein